MKQSGRIIIESVSRILKRRRPSGRRPDIYTPPHTRARRRFVVQAAGLLTLAALVTAARPPEQASASAEPPLTITIGVSEDLYTNVFEDELKPLRTYVEEAGVRITEVRFASWSALAESLAHDRVDIGMFTPLAYVRAHAAEPSITPFASHVINGTRYAQGYILVRADSSITELAGLRGKRFAYTDLDSWAGYLFPRYALQKTDLPQERFFAGEIMTRDYLESLRALFEGRVDGTAVLDEVLRVGEAAGLPRQAFRVLAKSRRVPYMAYVARPHLPESTIDQLRRLLTGHRFKRFFLHVKSPLELPGPWSRLTPRRDARWNINGFVTVSDRDFDDVRRMLKFVESDRP